jgi:branched-subunit amino acid ABC-type transport system permease component
VADLLEYAIRGIPTGCVFALLAVGLVLTYKTSGVFNLAYGAQAYASAAVFYVLRKEHGWPLWAAALVAIVVVGPAIGLLLERTLFRFLRGAGSMAKLVTSMGLLIAIPEVVRLFLGSESKKNPPPLWWVRRTDEWLWPEGGRFVLDAGQVATIASTAVVVLALVYLFNRTDLGLRMRAVVESPRMAELHGVDAESVSMTSWALSSLLAGLAGVLVAPLFASLNPIDLFTLLVAALAATVVGGLSSIPLTFAGGIALGVLQAVLAGSLPTDSVLATGLRPALPFVVLFALLILRPGLRSSRDAVDPLAAVDPPPPAPVAQRRPEWMTLGTRAFGGLVVAVGFALCFWVLDAFWLGLVVSGVVLATTMLSITTWTGLGGMLCLSPAAFAAVGAFATAQLVQATGMPVIGAMVLGGVLSAALGAVLAIPVVRLDGVYLALATLAFALMFEAVLVPLGWVSGGATPLDVPRPLIGPVDLADDRWFLVFAALCLTVVGLAVIRLREGTTGRFLQALHMSPTAAASIGISGIRARVVAFTFAAGIAGFGGGLMASYMGQANYQANFGYLIGLVWVALVVSAGARSVQAAVMSGMFFFLAPALLERLFSWPGNFLDAHPDLDGPVASVLDSISPQWANPVAFILFGFGAITYARHPEGSIEAQTAVVVNAILRRTGRRGERSGSVDGHDDPAGTQPPRVSGPGEAELDVRTPEPASGSAS